MLKKEHCVLPARSWTPTITVTIFINGLIIICILFDLSSPKVFLAGIHFYFETIPEEPTFKKPGSAWNGIRPSKAVPGQNDRRTS
jgi:hypothetical protein